jgi:hypothetical protein
MPKSFHTASAQSCLSLAIPTLRCSFRIAAIHGESIILGVQSSVSRTSLPLNERPQSIILLKS